MPWTWETTITPTRAGCCALADASERDTLIEVTPAGADAIGFTLGDPACYPTDAQYREMVMDAEEEYQRELYGLQPPSEPTPYPTLAERLAESMKDDRNP